MDHPPRDVLLRFALDTANRQENRLVVRHLLTRCPSCAAVVRELVLKPSPSGPESYEPAFVNLASFLETLCDEEEDRLQSTVATGSTARRRWPFG